MERSKSLIYLVRNAPPLTRILLSVQAGGRCEFKGCNRYLFEHHLTLSRGNFSQMAHIVAFSDKGPRGGMNKKKIKIAHNIDNLLLLCPSCHKEIDDHPNEYKISLLKGYKKEHEKRIKELTGLAPDLKTTIIEFKARINEQPVSISKSHIRKAIAPLYPRDDDGIVIDLNNISDKSPGYIDLACNEIKKSIQRLYASENMSTDLLHISLFALGSIPLLVFLGSELSNKIPIDFYQRHRDDTNWTWKKGEATVTYGFKTLRNGSDKTKVALILSLSGPILLSDLPVEIDNQFFVYEISLEGITPNPKFLNTRKDLENFRAIYQTALREIAKQHGRLDVIDLFPAIPAPIAVLCGHDLLPKIDPIISVYDNNKANGGFIKKIRINEL